MGDLKCYRLGEVIGRGGMSVVHSAVRIADHAEMSVKIFMVEEGHHKDELACKFLQEARLLSQLDHPNLVKVYDWGIEEGRPWLAMERIVGGEEGGDAALVARLSSPRPLTDEDVRSIYGQLRSVLKYCHEQEIVHGDLKAENVLLAADGTVKLADFGIARVLNPDGLGSGDEAWPANTLSGVICTPYASAPECRRGEKPSLVSDVYSFGVLLFRMLTGLWYDGTPRLLRQLKCHAPAWAKLLPSMLAEDPRRRISSALKLPETPSGFNPHRVRNILLSASLLIGVVSVLIPVGINQAEAHRRQKAAARREAEDRAWGRAFFGTNSFDYVEEASMAGVDRIVLERPIMYGTLHLADNKRTTFVDPPPRYYGGLMLARNIDVDGYNGIFVHRDWQTRVFVSKHGIRLVHDPNKGKRKR